METIIGIIGVVVVLGFIALKVKKSKENKKATGSTPENTHGGGSKPGIHQNDKLK